MYLLTPKPNNNVGTYSYYRCLHIEKKTNEKKYVELYNNRIIRVLRVYR